MPTYGNNMADLIMRAGEARADAVARKGAIWGQTIASLPQSFAEMLQRRDVRTQRAAQDADHAQVREVNTMRLDDAKAERATREQVQRIFSEAEDLPTALRQIERIDPKMALTLSNELLTNGTKRVAAIEQMAQNVTDQASHMAARPALTAMGIPVPLTYDPKWWDSNRDRKAQLDLLKQQRAESQATNQQGVRQLMGDAIIQRGGEPLDAGTYQTMQGMALKEGVTVPVGIVPAKVDTPTLPTSAQEYEYAKKQGYAGTYEQYQNMDANRKRPVTTFNSNIPTEPDTPLDPGSQDLMSQAGLTYNGFLALTGKMSQLPRDKETRNRASAEVQAWARKRGMDVATLGSQYKAYNEALENNIQRYNRTLLAEGEIAADVTNLLAHVKETGLGDVRAINAAKQWLNGELNDPNAAQYAFFLNQLTNDIALYNASSQGRATLQSDVEDAKSVVQRGIAAGSLTGMQKAITASVEKMGTVLEGAVNRSRQNVWDLFGVGDKYKPTTSGGGAKVTRDDAPKVGDIKTFPNGKKGKWDGDGWEPMR